MLLPPLYNPLYNTYQIHNKILINLSKMSISLSRQKIKRITQEEFDKLYEYKNRIDQGTYGIVCQFQDTKTHQRVAGKYLKDQSCIDGFIRQEEIMNKIDQENVLKCLGLYLSTTKNQYILITPFCQEGNLKNKLSYIKCQDEKLKICICLQIARGVDALHQKNIMHRDIKPANILFDKNMIAKLCDFGFGKVDNQDLEQSVKVGTPLYRDPNTNTRKYTKKCDIYSTGLVFDTIFRGKSIYQGIPQDKIVLEQINFLQKRKQIIGELQCCSEMKEIILGCLEKQQSKRLDSKSLLQKVQNLWSKYEPTYLPEDQMDSFSLENSQTRKQKNLKKFQNANQIKDQKLVRMETFTQRKIHTEGEVQNLVKSQIRHNTFSNSTDSSSKPISKIQSESNFCAKLLKVDKNINKSLLKNNNFSSVTNFFIKRHDRIRQLELLSQIISIPRNDKKIIIYIGLFGYLRFLKAHKMFLENKQQSRIKHIEGVTFDNISDQTKKICLQYIEEQTEIIRGAIKPYLVSLNNDKTFYKQKLTENVIMMINNGFEKKFITIEEFQPNTIRQEYINLLTDIRYKVSRVQENQLKEKLQDIQMVF